MSQIELTYTEPQLQVLDSIKPGVKYVVVPKGRRFGATQSFAHYFIECAMEGESLLWGDTIHPNIDRYVERYFEPPLKKHNINYKYNGQKKELRLPEYGGYIDFRSADKPENWEGFGYNKIFLNEAGIILRNEYLYTNAVLPMLLDYQNSVLIAAGAPKGKKKKDGTPHRFYKLAQTAMSGKEGYVFHEFSSYDNPLLRPEDIQQLEQEIGSMNPEMIQQEIYGKFVDGAAGLLWDSVIIERQRIHTYPRLIRKAVAIDPATTANNNSDETGIIVVGLDSQGNGYVLDDYSGKYSPNEWAVTAKQAFTRWECDLYVAESNQGGDMVENVVRQYDPNNRIKLVRATKGKYTRAEPIFSFYEQGKIFHVGLHQKLETQLANFNPETGNSPDRVDALVWGFTELMLGQTRRIPPVIM